MRYLLLKQDRSVSGSQGMEGRKELADEATWRAVIVALLLLQDVAELLRLVGRDLFTGHVDLSAQVSVAASAEEGS